jgi:hypothetical protein
MSLPEELARLQTPGLAVAQASRENCLYLLIVLLRLGEALDRGDKEQVAMALRRAADEIVGDAPSLRCN